MFILPVVAYLLFLVIYFSKKRNVVEAIAVAWLFITLYSWVIVEVSSSFGILGTPVALVSWGVLCVALAGYFIRKKIGKAVLEYCRTEKRVYGFVQENRRSRTCLTLFCFTICLLSVLRGQNLIDNLYHRLPKIMHWIQDGRVGYFATVTPAEIQYTKLTEYMIAQIYLLKGSDRFINLVQAGAYVCSLGCLYGISRKIGASRKFAMLSVWIYCLTPMVIIEVFTAQTDIVAGVYLLIFLYILLDFVQADRLSMSREGALSAVYLSSSVMFGYLTKPTVCFAMVVFFVWMCFVRVVRRDRIKVLMQYVLIGAVTACVLFLPDALRTYRYVHMSDSQYVKDAAAAEPEKAEVAADSGERKESSDKTAVWIDMKNSVEIAMDTSGTGGAMTLATSAEVLEDQRVDNTSEADRVISGILDPKEFMIVAIRNLAANTTSRCFPKINDLIVRFVEKCESALNYEGGYRYFRVMLGENLGETSEPSPAIMYFLLAAWICVLSRFSRIRREQLVYLVLASLALVIQSGLMGYTWYRQRYLLGVMGILCPAFAVVVENISVSIRARLNLAVAMMAVCSLGAANAMSFEIPYTVFGFQGKEIHKYFIHDSGTELYYQLMLDYINEHDYRTAGMIGVVSYEYVLWQGIEDLERLEHVGVNPVYFEAAKLEDQEFIPECIIEEIPGEFVLDEFIYIHEVPYICDWKATDENGRNYAVLIPYTVYEEQNAVHQG